MDDLLREFLVESFENINAADQELVRFERNPQDKVALDKIFRLVHTVKGTCGFLGLSRLEELAHGAESLLGQFREGTLGVTPALVSLVLKTIDRFKSILSALEQTGAEPAGDDSDLIEAFARAAESVAHGGAAEQRGADKLASGEEAAPSVTQQTVRVGVELLDQMMTLVSELVLSRNQLLQLARTQVNSEFKVPLQRLSNLTSDLQDSIMKMRMQPIGQAWSQLPRLVRDLEQELGREIELKMTGEETELDRQVIELIKGPLLHMLRNAADHGLEPPGQRIAAGKPARGLIRLSAVHDRGNIVIAMADDGRGINTAEVREQALARGLATEAALARMSEPQIHRFIFHPGFSTASQVTSVSGRGVGLDVVLNNIEELGGAIDVASVPGQGTTFSIHIPLSLTIISALIVEAGKERFAVPQSAVLELVRAKPGTRLAIERIHNAPVLRLRNRLLPLICLADALALKSAAKPIEEREAFIVVVQIGNRIFGIAVDRVFDTEEIVVKPLASVLRHIAEFSGSTILGDGSVIMIVDPQGIGARLSDAPEAIARASAPQALELEEAEGKTALLLFKAGRGEPMAVPLERITRLEEVDAGQIELCDGRPLLHYRGALMPIASVGERGAVKASGRQALLVIADGPHTAALAVDEILDIASEKLVIEIASNRTGTLGTARIRGRATEVIDVAHYLKSFREDWSRAPKERVA